MRGSQVIEATDDDGRFALRTNETGPQILVAFAPGFWSFETVLDLDGTARDIELNIEPARLAETAEVAAPSPEDAAPSVQAFTPLDVVQLPGAQADVMRYVQNLAGVNQINEEAGLFVRGGDSNEVLTMLDDAVLYSPYRYETRSWKDASSQACFGLSQAAHFCSRTRAAASASVGMPLVCRLSAPEQPSRVEGELRRDVRSNRGWSPRRESVVFFPDAWRASRCGNGCGIDSNPARVTACICSCLP